MAGLYHCIHKGTYLDDSAVIGIPIFLGYWRRSTVAFTVDDAEIIIGGDAKTRLRFLLVLLSIEKFSYVIDSEADPTVRTLMRNLLVPYVVGVLPLKLVSRHRSYECRK